MLNKVPSPHTELRTLNFSMDDVFSLWTGSRSDLPGKLLFWGKGAGEISSYGAGWMAGKGMDAIVLDGANRFDPYKVSFLAKKALMLPEVLLKRIQIARAFTCYQMVTLVGEKLTSLLDVLSRKPWVILIGPVTPFLDEDVSEREVRPLFERVLKKIENMAATGVPFVLFQPPDFIHSKRSYLGKRLFQFSDLVLRIDPDGEEPKMIVEKGAGLNIIENCKLQNEKCKFIKKDLLPLSVDKKIL